MRSSVYRSYPMVLVALAGLVALGCNREGEQVDPDLPIVVEAQGPIALGDAEPTEEEVDFVEEPEPEPQVITRTVIVRETPPPPPPPAAEPEAPPAEVRPAAPTAIPAGTRIPTTLLSRIDSENNEVGQEWTARVNEDVLINGYVVIPSGATVRGVIAAIDEGDRNDGYGSMTLEARTVETSSGSRAIAADPVAAGESYRDSGFPTKETAIGAGSGAVIGGIIGGKKGAVIGGVIGGAGGAGVGQARGDYEVAVESGTGLVWVTNSPVGL